MVCDQPKKCLVIGDPIDQSLSPLMHSAAYAECGIADSFSFERLQVRSCELEEFMCTLPDSVVGVSVTIPHKIAVMELLDELTDDARKIAAVNTICIKDKRKSGSNTDWYGVVEPIKKYSSLQGKHALVVGAGGAARSAIYGLRSEGALVSVANRTVSRAESLVDDFKIEGIWSSKEAPIADFDVIVNTTSVGMTPDVENAAVNVDMLREGQLVFDAVYNPLETKLLRAARAKGCHTVSGVDMFVEQGARQFEMYTGQQAPVACMRAAVIRELQKKNEED